MFPSRKDSGNSSTRSRFLVGVAVLSLLVVALTPQVLGRLEEQKIAETRATMSRVSSHVQRHAKTQGAFPRTDDVMKHLATGFAAVDEDALDPLAGERPRDAWGNELIYWYPGTYNTQSFDLASAGPDGVLGNGDDITNWER